MYPTVNSEVFDNVDFPAEDASIWMKGLQKKILIVKRADIIQIQFINMFMLSLKQ